jgi:hypothetical protein
VRDAVSAAWSLLGNRLGAQAGVADPSPEDLASLHRRLADRPHPGPIGDPLRRCRRTDRLHVGKPNRSGPGRQVASVPAPAGRAPPGRCWVDPSCAVGWRLRDALPPAAGCARGPPWLSRKPDRLEPVGQRFHHLGRRCPQLQTGREAKRSTFGAVTRAQPARRLPASPVLKIRIPPRMLALIAKPQVRGGLCSTSARTWPYSTMAAMAILCQGPCQGQS